MKLALALLLLAFSVIAAARPIDPPLAALRVPQAVAVVGTITAIDLKAAAFDLEISSVIRGQAGERISIDTHAAVLPRLVIGSRYAVVYAGLQAMERKPGVYRKLERGRLLSSDGVAVPIYLDTPQIRELLASEHIQIEQRADYLATVRAGLRSVDPQLLDLWTGELLLRENLLAQLVDADRESLALIAASVDTPPPVRARLLLGSLQYPAQLGGEWAAEVARSIIETAPVHAAGGVYEPDEPVAAAFDVLSVNSEQTSVAAAARWLRSPRPALAEQAALLIRRIDPAAERPAIAAAFAESLLPALTRKFLQDHLRRLDVLDANKTGA